MKSIKYLLQFLLIMIFFIISKITGLKLSSNIISWIVKNIGPLFRSKNLINHNLRRAFPNADDSEIKQISKKMWSNYGRILTEYFFIKNFRISNFKNNVKIDGKQFLEKIRNSKKPVIFISGHFNNFELMAMFLEMSGINLSAIYRPLNNRYLNFFVERIRKKYICKNQIKKGKSGTRELLNLFKKKFSVALMIDQRVSEGESIKLFNHPAKTTTIPAQLVKKYGCIVVPVHIERVKKCYFKLSFNKPIKFDDELSTDQITLELNKILEKMILKNPSQWIWSHDRWK